jgi:glycosyltransferase involved in cell wall biosynthesis
VIKGEPELAINGRFLMQATTGVQRVARELTHEIDSLAASGEVPVRIRLICQPEADVSELQLQATEVVRIGGLSGHAWEQLVLPRATGGATLLSLGNTAPLSSLLGPGRTAVMIHDLSYQLYPEVYTASYRIGHSLMLPMILHFADVVLTVSEVQKVLLSSLVPSARRRIVVAQNGGWRDSAVIPAIPQKEGNDQYLLYVGSLSQRKNIEGVLAASVAMARRHGMRSILVGARGSCLRKRDLIVPSDVKDLVEFVGQVEQHDALAELYRGASCLLFPSFYEASPLPPLEAMRFGCPVVVSDTPALRERCGDAAEYCDPHDMDSIVIAIERVVLDPVRIAQLQTFGRAQTQRFTWKSQAKLLLSNVLHSQ